MQTLIIALLCGLAGLLLGVLFMRRSGAHADERRELDSLHLRTAALERELAQLTEQQRATREILASMGDGVLVVDDHGLVQEANPAAARLLEASSGQMRQLPVVQSVRSFPALALLDRALAGGPFQDLVELPGGRLLIVQAIPLEGDGLRGRRVLFLLRDETSRLRTEKMRRDFVANVSHELKTPLARLSLLAATLRHAVKENPEQTEDFLERLTAEVSRLGALVTDLLTLSEVEEQGLSEAARDERNPDAEIIDLAEIATAAAATLRASFEEAGISFALRLEPVPVLGDPVYLETVARNLLDNALRYSDIGGRVEMTVRQQGDSAVLAVKDDGRGIPRDAQDRIFERFFRVDPARSRDTGGTGLGLSIVRHIIEQHGGRISVKSAVGVGSTFTVTLPKA
jgi:two-component system phosphate regulon sensor histidine kinase PhoR